MHSTGLMKFLRPYLIITPELRSRLEKKFQMGAQSNSYLVESVTGIQTVKSLAIEGGMQRKWEDYLARYINSSFKLSNISDCKTCLLLKLCSNCYAANYQSTGHILKVDPNLCDFNKMCVLASAKIQYYRIMKKASFTQDDFLILKAISTIQEKLIKHEYK